MAKTKEPTNPFYVLVVLVGVVFLVTACGYGTMTYRAIAPHAPREEPHALMIWLDEHGMALMAGELAALAVATVGAMGLDRLRTPGSPGGAAPDEGPEK